MPVKIERSGPELNHYCRKLISKVSWVIQETNKSSSSKLVTSQTSSKHQLNQYFHLFPNIKYINRSIMASGDSNLPSGNDFPDIDSSNTIKVDSPNTDSRKHLKPRNINQNKVDKDANLNPDSIEEDSTLVLNSKRENISLSMPDAVLVPNFLQPKKNSSQTDASKKSNMAIEAERLASFRDWPLSSPVRPAEMARAGLFFKEKPDTVECFACGGQLREWVHGDSAMGEHRKLCPDCPFVNGEETGNVPFNPHKELLSVSEETSLEERAKVKTESLETKKESYLTSVEESKDKNKFTYNESEDVLAQEATRTFKNERKRLMSFIYWPTNSGIEPRDLAKAGFYYCGSDDRVQCFTCFGILRNWEMGDIPMEEHKKHFPDCPFIRGDDVGNIPLTENNPESASVEKSRQKAQAKLPLKTGGKGSIGGLGAANSPSMATVSLSLPPPFVPIVNQTARPTEHSNPQNPRQYPVLNKARHSEYVDEQRRLLTFTENEWPIEAMIPAQDLSQAGFYYIGVADNVKCFYCDGGLRNWELGDEPWREHARWFPKCEFLIRKKGSDWVESIRREFPLPGQDDEFEEQGFGSMGSYFSGGNASHHDPSFSSHSSSISSHHSVNVGPQMDSPMVQMVLEMGYHRDTVKQAVERRVRSTGSNFPNTEDLLQAVWDVEDQINKGAAEATEKTAQLTETAVAGEGDETLPVSSLNSQPPDQAASGRGDSVQGAFSAPPNIGNAASGSSSVPEIQKQLETLKDRVMCKVCMDNDACMLFLPCKHVVTCEHCAASLRKCPVCRSRIKTSTKIFF